MKDECTGYKYGRNDEAVKQYIRNSWFSWVEMPVSAEEGTEKVNVISLL